jgi:DNA-binding sugar fermentation-stimulating protein
MAAAARDLIFHTLILTAKAVLDQLARRRTSRVSRFFYASKTSLAPRIPSRELQMTLLSIEEADEFPDVPCRRGRRRLGSLRFLRQQNTVASAAFLPNNQLM